MILLDSFFTQKQIKPERVAQAMQYVDTIELQAFKYQKSFYDKMLNNEFEQGIENTYYNN